MKVIEPCVSNGLTLTESEISVVRSGRLPPRLRSSMLFSNIATLVVGVGVLGGCLLAAFYFEFAVIPLVSSLIFVAAGVAVTIVGGKEARRAYGGVVAMVEGTGTVVVKPIKGGHLVDLKVQDRSFHIDIHVSRKLRTGTNCRVYHLPGGNLPVMIESS